MSFLTFSVPSSGLPSTDKASDHKPQIKEQEKGSTLKPGNAGIRKAIILLLNSVWPLVSKDTISGDSIAVCLVEKQGMHNCTWGENVI